MRTPPDDGGRLCAERGRVRLVTGPALEVDVVELRGLPGTCPG